MSDNLPIQQEQKSLFLDAERFDHVQRVARMFLTSTMVPEHFRGENNLGNCVIALNYANRLNIDPVMLMQKMYIVKGRPGIEAQLAIALINSSGKFTPLSYKFTGEPGTDSYGCVAWAKHTETKQRCESAAVTIGLAKKEGWYQKTGSKWQTMPELMLQYRSAAFFARAHCPETILGLHTREELIDIVDEPIDVTPKAKQIPEFDESDLEKKADIFDAEIKKWDIDAVKMADFISLVAAQNHMTEIEVKVEAVKSESDTTEFVNQFLNYLKSEPGPKAPPQSESKKEKKPENEKSASDWSKWSNKWNRLGAKNFKAFANQFVDEFRLAPAEIRLLAEKKWTKSFDESCPWADSNATITSKDDDNATNPDGFMGDHNQAGENVQNSGPESVEELHQSDIWNEMMLLKEQHPGKFKALAGDYIPQTRQGVEAIVKQMNAKTTIPEG